MDLFVAKTTVPDAPSPRTWGPLGLSLNLYFSSGEPAVELSLSVAYNSSSDVGPVGVSSFLALEVFSTETRTSDYMATQS